MENKYFEILSVLENINVDLTGDINKMKRLDDIIIKRKLNDLKLGFHECLTLVGKMEGL